MNNDFHLAIICGGCSRERGISLNSARSVYDHLKDIGIKISIIYVNTNLEFFKISEQQLYSNTPSDFDFKTNEFTKLAPNLKQELRDVNIAFPVIHGKFGEDGALQKLLHNSNIPFVGSNQHACEKMFYKHIANPYLESIGVKSIHATLIDKNQSSKEINNAVTNFFAEFKPNRVIVKPSAGGSSIGVFSCNTTAETLAAIDSIFTDELDEQVLIEPFCVGREFTIIVLENEGKPVPLIPTEISITYEDGNFLDYRRKYLPSSNTRWLCPTNFSEAINKQITSQAKQIFEAFKMNDFVRLDGWVLNNGEVIFTDINPISGLEQNSFIFLQGAFSGFTHRDLLYYIVRNACKRHNLSIPSLNTHTNDTYNKGVVNVLFGGVNSEKHVSLMSGSNVWLKLKYSNNYTPEAFFIDSMGEIWHLPYALMLYHNVEQIEFECLNISKHIETLYKHISHIAHELGVKENRSLLFVPQKMSLETFLQYSKAKNAYVFIALHGGIGENGVLQKKLEDSCINFNGSNSITSAICMDKYRTAEVINNLNDSKIIALPKVLKPSNQLSVIKNFEHEWAELTKELASNEIIVKPNDDGCSSGVAKLCNAEDFKEYINAINHNYKFIPANTFSEAHDIIDLPNNCKIFLFEKAIQTDEIKIKNNSLKHLRSTGWVELTVGVIYKNFQYHSLNPSITISDGAILSVEEKFQGGTGVNLTPPPSEIINDNQISSIKTAIEKIAQELKIGDYARIDIFFNCLTNQLIVIEINNLPGLTASTVIYHQALAENPPRNPREFLEDIIKNSNKILESFIAS